MKSVSHFDRKKKKSYVIASSLVNLSFCMSFILIPEEVVSIRLAAFINDSFVVQISQILASMYMNPSRFTFSPSKTFFHLNSKLVGLQRLDQGVVSAQLCQGDP